MDKISQDFAVRNVMIGVLRNRKQLDYNIKYKFYHIPEEWVLKSRFPIKYVALYQAPRLFKREDTGVYVYGKVIKIELVERSLIHQIPTNQNPKKLYYKFYVEEWLPLKRAILPGNIVPDVSVFTSEYQFFNASDVSELFLEKREHWDFYHTCRRLFPKAILVGKGSRVLGVKVNEYYAEWCGDKVKIYKAMRRIQKVNIADFDEKRCIEMFEKQN